ncbi:fibronectin type III domain-containing protein [Patescibacteria group bacterium]|nr:fibronectin type III domain-containing protein [Patescibacteria group bacterium]MBU1123610.1 fibronectin type III domain-containing protein [Patescibacteria group bacterium]MBU1911897.1 fibronectin type III domain-containing protein [Patescibacteria group bacterium]
MIKSHISIWHKTQKHIVALAACGAFLIASGTVYAQSANDITLVLQPHCVQEEINRDTILGPTPDIDPLIELGDGHCYDFEVENPQSLKTPPLKEGDILDIDIVIKNPQKTGIKRARVWLNYDTTILMGDNLEVNDNGFPDVTPGEEDFDETDGFVMIDATADTEDLPDNERVIVARVEFEVLKTPAAGTIISFYDVQPEGHTFVLKDNGGDSDGVSALSSDPGSLKINFAQGNEECLDDDDCLAGTCVSGSCTASSGLNDGESCQIDSQCESGNCDSGRCTSDEDDSLLSDGSTCTDDNECESNNCLEGTCSSITEPPSTVTPLKDNGEQCSGNSECISDNCVDGICTPNKNLTNGNACISDDDCESKSCVVGICIPRQESDPQDQTAFSILQVQNLRVTTKENQVFLGWDPLQSSQLKAYNIYYGTTQGQYIQRKTVEGTMQNLMIRNMPEGTTYYFAIRAISLMDEESAYSNEVYVTVGNPASSSSPLTADMGDGFPDSTNPIQEGVYVPGATGIPSPLAFLIFASAIIGTVFASRRQFAATSSNPK